MTPCPPQTDKELAGRKKSETRALLTVFAVSAVLWIVIGGIWKFAIASPEAYTEAPVEAPAAPAAELEDDQEPDASITTEKNPVSEDASRSESPAIDHEAETDLTLDDTRSQAHLMVRGDMAAGEAVVYAAQALTRYPPDPACADIVVYAAKIVALKQKGFSQTEAGAYVVLDINYRRKPLDAEGMGGILAFVSRIYTRFSDYRTATDTLLGECA